jgi:hypothetical protein
MVGLALFGNLPACVAQGYIPSIIYSNAVWTRAGSPYTLSWSVTVKQGATLTVEPGTTVNLNSYLIRIEGTLNAKGTAADPVRFNGGTINLLPISKGWNQQTGSGSIIQYAILTATNLVCNVSLNLDNDFINAAASNSNTPDLTVGSSSIISNSVVNGKINAGPSSQVTNCTITGNIIGGAATTVSNNAIKGGGSYYYDASHAQNIEMHKAITVGANSKILNNQINGEVIAVSSIISNNAITGGEPMVDFIGRAEDPSSAVDVSGNPTVVSHNTISSPRGGYGVTVRAGYTEVTDNMIFDTIIAVRAGGDATIEDNGITGSDAGINVGRIMTAGAISRIIGEGNVVVRNNTITDCSMVGVGGFAGGTATIEKNLIMDNAYGLSLRSSATVRYNTITRSDVGVRLKNSPSAVIAYNNIVGNRQSNLCLENTLNDVGAAYNWWGTTDPDEIASAIYDFTENATLGKVSFTPFLTAPNPENPTIPVSISTPTSPGASVNPEGTFSPSSPSIIEQQGSGQSSGNGGFPTGAVVAAVVAAVTVVAVVVMLGKLFPKRTKAV